MPHRPNKVLVPTRVTSSKPSCELALQHVVDRRPGVGEIGVEVADAAAHALRQDLGIGGRDRLQHRVVEVFVEVEDLAVPVLPRVEALARAAARLPGSSRSRPARAPAAAAGQRQDAARRASRSSFLASAGRRAPARRRAGVGGLAEEELADQALEHHRRLGLLDAVAGGPHLVGGARLDADVLVAEQAGGEDSQRRIGRELDVALRSPAARRPGRASGRA